MYASALLTSSCLNIDIEFLISNALLNADFLYCKSGLSSTSAFSSPTDLTYLVNLGDLAKELATGLNTISNGDIRFNLGPLYVVIVSSVTGSTCSSLTYLTSPKALP